jgi:hypothetical protein
MSRLNGRLAKLEKVTPSEDWRPCDYWDAYTSEQRKKLAGSVRWIVESRTKSDPKKAQNILS